MCEDVIHYCNFYVVVLMLRGTPPDACFKTIFSECLNTEDMCFDVSEETHVVLTCTHSERFSDVFKKMHMADLDNGIWKDINGCLFDRRVVITRYRDQRVVHII